MSFSKLDMLCRHDLQHHSNVDVVDTTKKVEQQEEKKKIDFGMRKKKRKQKFDKKRTTSYAEQRVLSLSKLSGHCVLSTDSSGRIQVLRIQAQTSRVGSNGTHQHCEDTRSHEMVRMYNVYVGLLLYRITQTYIQPEQVPKPRPALCSASFSNSTSSDIVAIGYSDGSVI